MAACWKLFIPCLSLVLATRLLSAQGSRIEQARQQVNALGATTPALGEAAGGSVLQPTIANDPDSFGIQQMLREAERVRPFRIFADVTAFATSNVALTRQNPQSDAFFLATFGFEYRRALPHGLQFDTSLRIATFRYNQFRQLDFNSIDAGAGISYHSGKLGGVDLFARYNFNELLGAKSGDVFFTNHTITLGLQKSVSFSQAHGVYFGLSGQVGFADPQESERSELSAFTGYHLQATRKLEMDLGYRYSFLPYSDSGRADHNQTVSLGLRYRFTEWVSASSSGFWSWNGSNRVPFQYEAASGGGGLSLSWQF